MFVCAGPRERGRGSGDDSGTSTRDAASHFRRDPGRDPQPADGDDLRPRRRAGGDGRDHGRRGHPGADRRLPRRTAREGRDGGRDRRVRRGDARARPAGASDSRRRRGRRRHGRGRRAYLQHLDDRGDRRGVGRRGRREARQPRCQLGLRIGGRPRGARVRARVARRPDRGVDRQAGLRGHVRPRAPSGDAPRRAGATRARHATTFNVSAADEPAARAGVSASMPRHRSHGRRRARRSRVDARVRRHGANGIDELASRPEPRVRGRRRRGSRAGPRSSRARDRRCDRPARRRHAGRERRNRAADLEGAVGAKRMRSCSTPRRRSRQPGMRAISARAQRTRRRRGAAAGGWSGSSSSRENPADEPIRRGAAAFGLAAIAEVKRRSPSAGDLRPDATGALAAAYESVGAAAVSILVDERFGGTWTTCGRRASSAVRPRKGLLLHRGASRTARDAGAAQCCSSGISTTRPSATCWPSRPPRSRDARRGTTRTSSSAASLGRPCRDQRARSLHVPHRPAARPVAGLASAS